MPKTWRVPSSSRRKTTWPSRACPWACSGGRASAASGRRWRGSARARSGERESSRSGKRLSQVHSRPTSSYSGGRSSRSSSDGARPRITEPMRRKVNGSEMRRIGCQKCLTVRPAISRSERRRPSVVVPDGASTSAGEGVLREAARSCASQPFREVCGMGRKPRDHREPRRSSSSSSKDGQGITSRTIPTISVAVAIISDGAGREVGGDLDAVAARPHADARGAAVGRQQHHREGEDVGEQQRELLHRALRALLVARELEGHVVVRAEARPGARRGPSRFSHSSSSLAQVQDALPERAARARRARRARSRSSAWRPRSPRCRSRPRRPSGGGTRCPVRCIIVAAHEGARVAEDVLRLAPARRPPPPRTPPPARWRPGAAAPRRCRLSPPSSWLRSGSALMLRLQRIPVLVRSAAGRSGVLARRRGNHVAEVEVQVVVGLARHRHRTGAIHTPGSTLPRNAGVRSIVSAVVELVVADPVDVRRRAPAVR